MRISPCHSKHLLSAVFILILISRMSSFASDESEKIKQAIVEKGAHWTPGESWVTHLSAEERKSLCGAIIRPPDPAMAKVINLPQLENLPTHFDWRKNKGSWVTQVKNQGQCGSCWDFAAVAQVESWWKIYNNNPDSMIDLSEQYILSCSGAGSCNGGGPALALEFIKINGIPLEACLPYRADDKIPCSNACSNWAEEAIKIPGWGYVTLGDANISNIKNAVFRQPVSAIYAVYEDFMYYSTGVYEHVSGAMQSGHVIQIIGWDDIQQYWICKNSWGTDWGETAAFKPFTPGAKNGGYFRIKWNECSIGQHITLIWNEITGGPAMAVIPNNLDFRLTIGDSTSKNITISNTSAKELTFFAMDCATPTATHFHSDRSRSYDGLSWWCGDPKLGGYGDYWLQYLDLPSLKLSSTTNPTLSFMGRWAMEDFSNISASVNAKYDSWDGCNVWISVDGGKKYNLAYPITPEYNCQSLFGFGDQGLWGMGKGIAGWASSSKGWRPVTFDLSPYKADSVVIRFALASDPQLSAIGDPALEGFFIDDIVVSDQGTTLFENDGDDDPSIKLFGYVGIEDADWIDLPYSMGSVSPYDSVTFEFRIDTKTLRNGHHSGFINISSNDTSISVSSRIKLNLDLIAPEYDVAVQYIHLPSDTIPLFVQIKPKTEIINLGQNMGTNFDVTCAVLCEGKSIYSDTTHIPQIPADQKSLVEFEPFVATQRKDLDFVISVLNFPNDYNSYNNCIRSTVNVTNLIDDFGKDSPCWNFDGGWGITRRFRAHSGNGAAHVNNGITPYENNMDAKMTFIPGFHFQPSDSATLKYWTLHNTEQDKDICYLEISGDSLNWIKMDSLSGLLPKWTQRQVSLTSFIAAGNSKVWLRFHFISDGQNTNVGVAIDDVEIYGGHKSIVHVTEWAEAIPDEYHLKQNYPNPFNPATTIEYNLPAPGQVRIVIYDLLGREVKRLVDGQRPSGHFQTSWDGTDENSLSIAAGVYFCRMQAGEFVKVIKLALLK